MTTELTEESDGCDKGGGCINFFNMLLVIVGVVVVVVVFDCGCDCCWCEMLSCFLGLNMLKALSGSARI